MRIGIIGYGVVGKAVSHAFDAAIDVLVVDPLSPSAVTIDELVLRTPEYIFVCVPSPLTDSDECDANIVDTVLCSLTSLAGTTTVIIKSTIDPGSIARLADTYDMLDIVYNPEFLLQRDPLDTFLNPSMQIFGGTNTEQVSELYVNHTVINKSPEYHTDLITASLVKYAINTFLSTKVTFMNVLKDVHEKSGAESSFEDLAEMIGADPRITDSHISVPGLDGKRGFTGACLPKDTTAFCSYMDSVGAPSDLIRATISLNKRFSNY